MSKQKDLAKNTLIIAVGKISTQFLSFLLLPLYTSRLAPNEFGTVDLIMTYVMLLAPVLTVQLEMAAFRFLIDARDNEEQKSTIINNVLQVVGVSLLVFALTYSAINYFVDVAYPVLIFGITAAVVLSNIMLQFARGLGYNTKFAIGSIIAGTVTIAANIVFIVVFRLGAKGMLMASVLANLACTLYLSFSLKLHKYVKARWRQMEVKKKLLSYSIPLVPNGISWWAINAADRTIISIFLGVASNGIYAVAYKFPLIFTSLFSFFGMAWTEAASMHINSKDRDSFFSSTFNNSIRLFGAMGLLMIAALPFVYNLLVGRAFSDAYQYVPLLILGSLFNSVVGLYSAVYIAKKMTRQVLNTSVVAAVISVLCTLLFVKHIGLYAAAASMALAYAVMAIYRYFDTKKYVSITYDFKMVSLIVGAYGVVVAMYYQKTTFFNVLNILFALATSFYLNRHIVRHFGQLLGSRYLEKAKAYENSKSINESR